MCANIICICIRFRRFICALICSEPETRIRQELQNRETAITIFGLSKSAMRIQQDGGQESKSTIPISPDEDAMAQVREAFGPPPTRAIESRHFDCVRPVVTKLGALTDGRNEPFLPSTEEISEYFASAAEPIRSPNGATHVPPDIAPFTYAHSAVYGHRRLFVSKRGYLGLGPDSMEIGDVIWLLSGFSMPVILRHAKENLASAAEVRDEHFNFIGAAYVHGIRDGEAAKLFTDQDVSTAILI